MLSGKVPGTKIIIKQNNDIFHEEEEEVVDILTKNISNRGKNILHSNAPIQINTSHGNTVEASLSCPLFFSFFHFLPKNTCTDQSSRVNLV